MAPGKRTLTDALPIAPRVQAKLEVSQKGDALEAEADAIADRVVGGGSTAAMSSGPPAISRAPATGSVVAAGGGERRAEGGAPPEHAIAGARGSGAPLAPPVREQMESALSADLSAVRIHTDSEANRLAQIFGARAFTTGTDIFFRSGEYRPTDRDGQRLLAHELVHVVQQAGGRAQGDSKLHRDPTDATGLQNQAAQNAWARYRAFDDRLAQLVTRIEQTQNVQLVVTTTPPTGNEQVMGNTRVQIRGDGQWVSPPRAFMNSLDIGTPTTARFRIIIYVSPELNEPSAMSVLIHEFVLHAEDFLATIGEFRTQNTSDDALLHWQLNADTGPRSPQSQHDFIRSNRPAYNTPRAELYRLFHTFAKSKYLREGMVAAQQNHPIQAFNSRSKAHLVEQAMQDDIHTHTQNPNL